MKAIYLFFFPAYFLLSKEAEAQNSFSKHHYFNNRHHSRPVVNKKYNQIDDSSFVSYEIMVGNTNAWNGDVFNQYPSVQVMCSYDDNKKFEIGVFGALTYASKVGQNPNGADIFASLKLRPKLYIICDIYTFLANRSLLENSLGYRASIYNVYSVKFQLNATQKQTWFLGYSVLNDISVLQQTFFIEFDYSLTKNIPVVLGFSTNNNVLSPGLDNFYVGLGLLSVLKESKQYALKLTVTFNPVYIDQVYQSWPLTFLIGLEF